MHDLGAASHEIDRSLQNLKDTSKGLLDKTGGDMRIPGGLLFKWGVMPSF
jgi:hypothetical protein